MEKKLKNAKLSSAKKNTISKLIEITNLRFKTKILKWILFCQNTKLVLLTVSERKKNVQMHDECVGPSQFMASLRNVVGKIYYAPYV